MWSVSAERMAEDPAHCGGYGWSDTSQARCATLREATAPARRAHLGVRIARVTAGSMVTLLGLALLLLPGPGLAVIAAGLSILAIDVPFAQRLLQQVVVRLPQDADGGTPTWLLVATGTGLAVSVAVSLALMLT